MRAPTKMEAKKIVSCVYWVPKGKLKEVPERFELSTAELEDLVKRGENMTMEEATTQAADSKSGAAAATQEESEGEAEVSDAPQLTEAERKLMKELKMDEYDEEEEGATMFLGGKELTVFESNTEDPYITVGDDGDASDDEDTRIRPNDLVLLAGRTDQGQSSLEVNVFDEKSGDLFVHHDFPLPSFPLCMAYMDLDPRAPAAAASATADVVASNRSGNFVAVGTFEPDIEIWNLDVIDVMEPVAVLGGRMPVDHAPKDKKKKKKSKKPTLPPVKPGSHTKAVMSLSWHPSVRERLASGSADHTVKLWDITTQQCAATLTHHSDKVQSCVWNPQEAHLLLTGAYDKTVAVTDTRAGSKQGTIKFPVDGDVECVQWHPTQPHLFAVSSEKGTVVLRDIRNAKQPPVFTLGAHSKPTSAIAFCLSAPILATASYDKTVKLWDIKELKPSLISSKDMKIGEIFSMNFSRDSPSVLACGGDKGKLAVWDISDLKLADVARVGKPDSEGKRKSEAPAAAGAAAAGEDDDDDDDEEGSEGDDAEMSDD